MQAYFATIERHELNLPDRRLDVPTGQKVLAVGAMMWDSGQFTSKQMHTWENKPPVDKTWDNIKDCFTQQWQEQQAYNKMTAKQSAFKEASMLAKEAEVAEQNAQIFALMQTQHNEQMKKMVENRQRCRRSMRDCSSRRTRRITTQTYPSCLASSLINPSTSQQYCLGSSRLSVRLRGASVRIVSVGVGIGMQTVWSWELEANKDKRPDGYKPVAAVV